MNRATVNEMAITAALFLAIALPLSFVTDTTYAAGVALAVVALANMAYWRLRGESALRGIKPRSTYEWEETE